MEFLKKAIGFVIGFALVYGAIHLIRGGDKLQAFEMYRSQEGRFSVLFPGEPKRILQSVDTPVGKIDLVLYQAGSKKTGFIVGYSDYPQEVIDKSNLGKMLDGARDGAVGNVGGELIDEMELEFQGYPGREVEIDVAGKTTVRSRLILIDNRLYQVMVVSPSLEIIEKKGTEFFDSFSVDEQ
jgi:hypothetical protein